VSCFGLNLAQDLSPDLLDQAVNSLAAKDRDIYTACLQAVIDSRLTKG
jgi:hypothetical protein